MPTNDKTARKSAPRRPVRLQGDEIGETPAAALAWESYYHLGEQRSLAKLAEQRVANALAQTATVLSPKARARKVEAELASLKRWSTQHGWQEAVKDRDRENFAILRREMLQEMRGIRSDLTLAVKVELGRVLRKLAKDTRPDADPIIVKTAKDLQTLLEVLVQVTGVELDHLDDDAVNGPTNGGVSSDRDAAAVQRSIERLLRRASL